MPSQDMYFRAEPEALPHEVLRDPSSLTHHFTTSRCGLHPPGLRGCPSIHIPDSRREEGEEKKGHKQHVQFILRDVPTSCHMKMSTEHPDDHSLVTQPYGVAGDTENCHLCSR